LNIQVSTTEGFSPLPDPDQLCQQLKAAGLVEVRARRLVPFESIWAFNAAKASHSADGNNPLQKGEQK
jgi:hypothetical protein